VAIYVLHAQKVVEGRLVEELEKAAERPLEENIMEGTAAVAEQGAALRSSTVTTMAECQRNVAHEVLEGDAIENPATIMETSSLQCDEAIRALSQKKAAQKVSENKTVKGED